MLSDLKINPLIDMLPAQCRSTGRVCMREFISWQLSAWLRLRNNLRQDVEAQFWTKRAMRG